MNVGIPCVDPIIYPPVHEGDAVRYPSDAPEGRQWRPPAAPHMDVARYSIGFGRACLECRRVCFNDLLLTGWLCQDCAAKETARADPFGVAAFWQRFTLATENMTPVDEYQWYRWYGWTATKMGRAVAPIRVFHDLTAAWNSVLNLGLVDLMSNDHVRHYIQRVFAQANMREEEKDALAAGLIPASKSTISRVDGIHD